MSSWAVSDSVLRDSQVVFVVCRVVVSVGNSKQELMLGPRKSAHMKIYRDDVISLTNSE